jgi:RNA polymerase primary sigma factor
MTSPLDAYVRDVRQLPRLTAAQAAELLDAWHAGDSQALNALWQEGLRLVLAEAGKLGRRGVRFSDDMIQEGNLAVGRALQTWDPAKGRLSTWLVPKIRGAMMDYSLKERTRGTGGKDAPEPIMRSLDDNVGVIDDYAEGDMPGQEEPESASRYDASDLGCYEPPDVAAQRDQLRAYIASALPRADKRTADILSAYFGFDGEGGKSAIEISDLYGMHRAHVHKLIAYGLKLMHDTMRHRRDT